MSANQAEIKKQVEFYLSDKNLANDSFFHSKISGNVEHWLDIADILNCNKIKRMGIKEAEIAASLKSSSEVEVSEDGKKVRRVGKKALPELIHKEGQKKRDVKAQSKEEEKGDAEDDTIQLDERGNHILVNADFENPIIIHFKTEAKDGDGFKVNWKEIENEVKQKNPLLKIVYSRADQYEGDLAISSHKLKQVNLEKLTSATLKVQEKNFTFIKTAGEELKDFWQKQGGHYQFCIQPKLRNIKKQQKIAKQQKRDAGTSNDNGSKRAKLSFEIAGVYYTDISKVKSKARAILTIKKDGEKLTGNDEEFIKELIKFHDKHDSKFKDFGHFEAGEHPNYEKTRCFFVVRNDGTKEDFSISKCIMNLEKQSQ
ncbi:lupus la [Stylonychia lemnae]|uniref:Lupus la n=1 Tax=Stylonychia lemnae TaxID=5949 RepID=A0A078A1H7_STYLE|nr:lupus la [Stylonychia lemnae]|eukprot:CDW75697.1 lupus la [Stylonychia lemnae]